MKKGEYPACEFLSSVWPNQHLWWELVNMLSGCELVFERIRTTDENRVNLHPGCELLSSVWADQNHWREWNAGCELFSSNWEDQKYWLDDEHAFRLWVSLVIDLEQIRTTNKGEHTSRLWVALQSSSDSKPLMRMGEHTSSLWVALLFLSWSEPLISMGEHASSLWVSFWADLNHWHWTGEYASREWVALQCLSKSEPLMMGDHIQAVSYSSVFEQVWTTDKNKHHLGCEWLSSV